MKNGPRIAPHSVYPPVRAIRGPGLGHG